MYLFKKIPVAFYILIFYTCFSGYFAFERILNTDNSYYFYNLLNTQNFWFAEHRFGIFPSQIPLLIFVHLGASLQTLIYVYSITFPLEYIAIALICEYYLKVKEAAPALALVLVTGIAYSFFHPVTETYHELAFSILLYAILVSDRFQQQKGLYYFFIFCVALLTIISHPVGVFTIGFVALFTTLSKQTKGYPFFFIAAMAIITTLLRMLFTSSDSYDIQQYDNLFATLKSLSEFGNLAPVLYLKSRATSVHFTTMLMAVAFGVLAIRSKQQLLLFISLVCCIGFAILGILTFSKGDADMMMEKTFMPSIFMLILPFCYLASHSQAIPKMGLHILILLIAVMGFRRIYYASAVPTQRLLTLEKISQQASHPKLIAEIGDFNEPAMAFNHWDTPVDSYILAKCKANKEFTLFLTADKHSFKFDSTDTSLFLGPPWAPYWKKKMMNQTYFQLPKTGYHVYENKQLK